MADKLIARPNFSATGTRQGWVLCYGKNQTTYKTMKAAQAALRGAIREVVQAGKNVTAEVYDSKGNLVQAVAYDKTGVGKPLNVPAPKKPTAKPKPKPKPATAKPKPKPTAKPKPKPKPKPATTAKPARKPRKPKTTSTATTLPVPKPPTTTPVRKKKTTAKKTTARKSTAKVVKPRRPVAKKKK